MLKESDPGCHACKGKNSTNCAQEFIQFHAERIPEKHMILGVREDRRWTQRYIGAAPGVLWTYYIPTPKLVPAGRRPLLRFWAWGTHLQGRLRSDP